MLESTAVAAIVLSVAAAIVLFFVLILLQCMCGRRVPPVEEKGEDVTYRPNNLFVNTVNKSHVVEMSYLPDAPADNPHRRAPDNSELRPTTINFDDVGSVASEVASCMSESPRHGKHHHHHKHPPAKQTQPAATAAPPAPDAAAPPPLSDNAGHPSNPSESEYDRLNPHLHSECIHEKLHDWGPGLASCARCRCRPIFNRGCGVCAKRLCPPCFAAHKEERISLLELAHLTVQYKSPEGERGLSLTPETWRRLMEGVREASAKNDQSAAEALEAMHRGMPEKPMSLQELSGFLYGHPVVASTLIRAFKKNNADFNLVQERGMAVPECSHESEMHDWGPGVASCQMCGKGKILNRGCRNCNKKLCEKCFNFHMQLAKLATEAMSGRLIGSKELEELEQHQAVQVSETAEKAALGSPIVPQPASTRSLPPDLAVNCPLKGAKGNQAKVMDTVDFLTDPDSEIHLKKGGALYTCACREGSRLSNLQLRMAASFVNLTSFEDELQQNGVPYVDPLSEEARNYIFLLNKGMYLMPPKVRSENLTARVFSSTDFHKNCQPGSGFSKPKVWTDVQAHHTFRLTKPVIPVVYSVTFQLKCSAVPQEHLAGLAVLCDDLPVHHAILMERTKRATKAQDSTLKLKSILCYHFLPSGGMVVTNVTCAINSAVPKILAGIVDNLSSMGAGEVYETAEKTRIYLTNLAVE